MGNAGGLTQALLGGWDVGAIVNGRSGLPIDVQVVRPDVAYVECGGNVFTRPRPGAWRSSTRSAAARRATFDGRT